MEGDILTKYIERMGTGTVDTIKRCRNFGLDEPEFALTDGFVVTIRRKPGITFEVVGGITGDVTALTAGMIEMTIPVKPTSSRQKYRLTQKGRGIIAKLARNAGTLNDVLQ